MPQCRKRTKKTTAPARADLDRHANPTVVTHVLGVVAQQVTAATRPEPRLATDDASGPEVTV